MQTSYDLVLQAAPGTPLELAPVEAAIRERGGVTRGDGALVWRFPAGDVVALPLKEAGVVTGLELKVPFSDRTDLLATVLTSGVELARTLSLRLVDPQLARTVLDADAGAVIDEFLRIARYAGQYYGIGDALPMAVAPSQEAGMSPVVRAVLMVLVFAVAMAAAYQYFSPSPE